MTATRRCRPTVDYIIQPHSWQGYGCYADGSVWAGAVRASNEYMARDALLQVTHDAGPVIWSAAPITPMPRAEKDKRRFAREN